MNELIPTSESPLAPVIAAAQSYVNDAMAKNTKKAYRSDWADFSDWCSLVDLTPLPAAPDTLVLYLTSLAERGLKPSTIERRRAAISYAHSLAGLDSPTTHRVVLDAMRGIRRRLGVAPNQKDAATTEIVRKMVAALPEGRNPLCRIRDQALILVGFAGAFRRSELASLLMSDVQFIEEGLVITLRKSKTDQEGQGYTKGIAYGGHVETCPVRALRRWIDKAGIETGPVFRPFERWGALQEAALRDADIARVVKKAVLAAGLDPVLFSGHSLRAGFVTSADRANISDTDTMRQTGHKTVTSLIKYKRTRKLFEDNPSAKLGL